MLQVLRRYLLIIYYIYIVVSGRLDYDCHRQSWFYLKFNKLRTFG